MEDGAWAESGSGRLLAADRNLPHVTIGMPVFNGELYIAQAIDSIVSQTFTDFELVISDNASTDNTERICRRYAAGDDRIRYYRSDRNRGAAWNHNRVVELAKGEYFKWQCHDDYCDRTFLEKCLAVLHQDPGVALCYSQFVRVNGQGRFLGAKSSRVLGEAEPCARFRSMIYRRDSCEEIYGITRTAVVKKTGLMGAYSNSDDTLLAELILHGRFREVPERLFFYRIHSGQSTKAYPSRSDRMTWFKPGAQRVSLPFIWLLLGYVCLLWRAPLSWRDRVRCYCYLPGWCWYFKGWFKEDLRSAMSRLPLGLPGSSSKGYSPRASRPWNWMKREERRRRRAQSIGRRAKRVYRAQIERWDLRSEE